MRFLWNLKIFLLIEPFQNKTRVYDWQVEVVALQYRARCAKELDLNRGDLIQVLFREDDTWWFGRLADEREGYFPAACVEPLEGSTDLSEVGSSSDYRRVKCSVLSDIFI